MRCLRPPGAAKAGGAAREGRRQPPAPTRPRPAAAPQVAGSPFARCSYTEAIEKLEAAVAGGRKFDNAVRALALP